MKHDSFYDFKSLAKEVLQNKSTDSNGEKVQWLKIKWLRFRKDQPNVMFFKYDFDDENFREISVVQKRGRSKKSENIALELKKAYSARLPISTSKYGDLISLCDSGAIPSKYKDFFVGLPTLNTVFDRLEEPDVEEDYEFEF